MFKIAICDDELISENKVNILIITFFIIVILVGVLLTSRASKHSIELYTYNGNLSTEEQVEYIKHNTPILTEDDIETYNLKDNKLFFKDELIKEGESRIKNDKKQQNPETAYGFINGGSKTLNVEKNTKFLLAVDKNIIYAGHFADSMVSSSLNQGIVIYEFIDARGLEIKYNKDIYEGDKTPDPRDSKLFINALKDMNLISEKKEDKSESHEEKNHSPRLSKEAIENAVFEIEMRELETKDQEHYHSVVVDCLKYFHEDDEVVAICWVNSESYSFSEGIFESQTGSSMPIEYRFLNENGLSLKTQMLAEDGSYYTKSLKKMARGDKELEDILFSYPPNPNSEKQNEAYDAKMKTLRFYAEIKGLKNFTYSVDEIPGYDKDVFIFENMENQPEGTISIVKKDDFEKAKDSIGKGNWPYYEGVNLHIESGIVTKATFDTFKNE